QLVDIFRALGDPTRLRILGLVAERSQSGTELVEAVAVGAPTVSHHMDKLVRAGLVTVERAGQSRIYSLNQQTLRRFATFVDTQRQTTLDSQTAELAIEPSIEERDHAKVVRDFFDG